MDSTVAMTPMPQYESHKKVWALKIASVSYGADGTNQVALTFVNESFAARRENIVGKPTPQPGWYLVQYEDGYVSFSPEKAFEEGYTLIK